MVNEGPAIDRLRLMKCGDVRASTVQNPNVAVLLIIKREDENHSA